MISLVLFISPFAYAQDPSTPEQKAQLQEKFKDINTKEEFEALSKEDQTQLLQLIGEPSLPSPVAVPENTVNCFDYYRFGSVQVDAGPNLASTVPGATLNFSGRMKNDNDYPIVEGQVYAKIFFKNQVNDSLTHQNGYPVIAEWLVQDNVTLSAKEEEPISFDWKVPESAQNGEYEIAFFFTSAYRYNLLGLSFTDDVTGNKAPFSIVSSAAPVAYFDKNSVKLNDTPFRFAAFPPHFTRDEQVTAYTTLVNPKNVDTVVAVTWELHSWDAMRPGSVIMKDTELVTLKPKEKKVLSHITHPVGGSVSYLIVTAKDTDSESKLNIRFVRDGIDETRINFPGITTYPLKAGMEHTLFSCVHSTNQPLVEGNTLVLTLKDAQENVIHSYTYEGGITGAMMGIKDTFTPAKDLSTFSLTASLSRQGTLVEEVTLHYDCEDIDSRTCITEDVTGGTTQNGDSRTARMDASTYYVLFGSVFLALSAIGYFVYRRRKATEEDVIMNEPIA